MERVSVSLENKLTGLGVAPARRKTVGYVEAVNVTGVSESEVSKPTAFLHLIRVIPDKSYRQSTVNICIALLVSCESTHPHAWSALRTSFGQKLHSDH